MPAYSTLGRFDDPLLSSFIRYPDAELARLMFHELAHQVVYVKDDSTFNESFAVVVEREGLRRWLAATGRAEAQKEFLAAQERNKVFIGDIEQARARLRVLYRQRIAPEAMRERKRAELDELKAKLAGQARYKDSSSRTTPSSRPSRPTPSSCPPSSTCCRRRAATWSASTRG